MRRLLATAGCAFALVCGAVQAQGGLSPGWEADLRAIGAAFWDGRTNTVCDPARVEYIVEELGQDAQGNEILGNVTIGDCRDDGAGLVRIDEETPLRGWRMTCAVGLHEWGHLLGREHRGGRVVMNPRINPYGWERWCRPKNRP